MQGVSKLYPYEQRLSLKKRPPLPKFDMVLPSKQIQLLEHTKPHQGSDNLSVGKENISQEEVFVKRGCQQRKRLSSCNGAGLQSIANRIKSIDDLVKLNLQFEKKLQALGCRVDGSMHIEKGRQSRVNHNDSKNQDRSSRVSTSYSQTSLKNKPQRVITARRQGTTTSQGILHKRLTSKSWVAYDLTTKQILYQKAANSKRQIASLTKIMTCLLTLQILSDLGLDANKLQVIVTSRATAMTGTSAQLKTGSILSLKSLLYGLMLPSGNDAAYCLAEYIGTIIYITQTRTSLPIDIFNPDLFLMLRQDTKKCVNLFIDEMNRKAWMLGMTRTHYVNPHGLSDKRAYSTCEDLIKLLEYCIKNKQFMEIVTSKTHQVKCQLLSHQYKWNNTHKLLEEGWSGIKTGVTPAAGPCLSSYYRGVHNGRKINFIVVLLQCQSMDKRYEQTKLLLQKFREDHIR